MSVDVVLFGCWDRRLNDNQIKGTTHDRPDSHDRPRLWN